MDRDDCLFGNARRLDAYISVIKAGPRLRSEFSRIAVETVNATKPVRKAARQGCLRLERSKFATARFFLTQRAKEQRGVICRNRNGGADDRD
jgi:hypothetical protein